MSMLVDLYYGKICPMEQYLPEIEEIRNVQNEHFKHYEGFLEKLDDPLKQEFEKIIEEQFDLVPYDFSQAFIDGFKIGARLMMEILHEDKEDQSDSRGSFCED